MKFVVRVDDKTVLLSAAQMEIFATALSGAERVYDIDVGKGNGTHGYADQYIDGVQPLKMSNHIGCRIMDDDEYEAMKFVAKQHEGKKP